MALVEERPATVTARPDSLPRPIVEVLERAIRRRRNVVLLRGALAVAAVGIGLLLGLMAVDYLVTIVSTTARWLLSAGALAIFLGAVAWFLVLPLSRRMTLVRMAQLVDAHHPEFEERVSSTVELLSARKGRLPDASPLLLEALTSQAVDRVRAVEPRREFNLRSVRPFLVAACCAAAVLAGLWRIWPTQTRQLMGRVLNPFSQGGNVRGAELEITPGSHTIGIGDSLAISATLSHGGARQATLLWQAEAGDETRVTMTRLSDTTDDDSRFVTTLPHVMTPLKYRVLLDNGALSDSYDIQVTPRPAAERFSLHFQFPAYTELTPRSIAKASGDIAAPVGTVVTLSALCNKPLREAQLQLADQPPLAASLADDGGVTKATWEFVLLPEISGSWHAVLTDQHDLKTTTPDHQVRAILDAPPAVGIVEPQGEVRLRPDDRLPIEYRVREDYGLVSAALLIRLASGKELSVMIGAPQRSSVERSAWVGRAVLDLRTLQLGGVPKIEVLMDVRDTRPDVLGGPQRGLSKPIVVMLNGNAQDHSKQTAELSIRKLSTALSEALNLLMSAKGQVTALRPTIDKQPLRLTPDGARQVETARTQSSQAEAILWKISDDKSDPELAAIGEQAGQIGQTHVAAARGALELIPLAHVKQEQVQQAQVAEEKLDAAIKALQEILKTMGAEQERLARSRELANEVGALADEQARLRKATDEAKDKATQQDAADDIAQRILAAQWQIAFDATALARKIDAAGYNAGPEHREASEAARAAANRLIDNKPDEAAPLGQQAATKFGQAKDKLTATPPQQPPQDPLDPPFAEASRRLQERQQNVNEQLAALKKGDLAKALESLQKDLAQRAKDLAERNKKMESLPKPPQGPETPQSQKGNPQGPKDVKGKGDDSLGQAAEKAEMAAADLGHIDNPPKISPPKFVEGPQSPSDSGGNPDGGQGTKGGGSNTGAGSSKKPSPSNNNINNTIAKGKNLGKATLTAEALMNQKPGANKGPSGGSGTELQKDAEELLRAGLAKILADNNPEAKGFGGFGGGAPDEPVPPTPPKEFGAEGGEEMPSDSPSSEGEGSGGEPGGQKPSKGAGKLGRGKGRVVARLGELGISGSDWLKLPTDLQTEILQSTEEGAPREYRELVRRYFQTMARRGAENRQP